MTALIRLSLTCLSLIMLSSYVYAGNTSHHQDTLNKFKSDDTTAPFFQHAYGYAVFPTIGKGGFGIGGAYGKGKVYRKGQLTGSTSMAQLTIGFQLGGQAYSQLIFFQDKRAYDEFTSGSFEFDATASAVAITAGAQAQAGTKGNSAGVTAGPRSGKQLAGSYYKGMVIFIQAKGGLMYEASLGGQKFNFTPNS